MFLLDLFSGVIFYQYGKELDRDSSLTALSCSQERINWIMIQRLLREVAPLYTFLKEPRNKFRKVFFRLVTRRWFSGVMYFTILVNTAQIALTYNEMSDLMIDILHIINYICTGIFVLEALCRLLAHKKRIFLNKWNYIELVIIAASNLR